MSAFCASHSSVVKSRCSPALSSMEAVPNYVFSTLAGRLFVCSRTENKVSSLQNFTCGEGEAASAVILPQLLNGFPVPQGYTQGYFLPFEVHLLISSWKISYCLPKPNIKSYCLEYVTFMKIARVSDIISICRGHKDLSIPMKFKTTCFPH